MIIAIDFDGTCVTHEYPEIGKDIGAVPVLKEIVARGHKLILFTMRSGHYLAEAVRWFAENEIPLWDANSNPEQHTWTASPKVYAQLYIDDAAAGCPVMYWANGRAAVDWGCMKLLLKERGVI